MVYIGDGVSAAQLFVPAAFAKLVRPVGRVELPVFSYGLGPRVDGQLLAALANYTGGTIVLDDGKIDPKEAGIFLAASARGPVAWPDSATWPKAFDEVYPHRLTPLRADRETVAVGKGIIENPVEIEAQGQAAGQPLAAALVGRAPAPRATTSPTSPRSSRMAEKDGGTTLPILGAKGLKQIGRMFLATADELIALAKQALKTDNFDDAERMVDEALRRDPNDPDAIALRGEIAKSRAEQKAAVKQPQAEAAAATVPASKNGGRQADERQAGRSQAGQNARRQGQSHPAKPVEAEPSQARCRQAGRQRPRNPLRMRQLSRVARPRRRLFVGVDVRAFFFRDRRAHFVGHHLHAQAQIARRGWPSPARCRSCRPWEPVAGSVRTVRAGRRWHGPSGRRRRSVAVRQATGPPNGRCSRPLSPG